jgi:acetyl-CoA acetyltransferase
LRDRLDLPKAAALISAVHQTVATEIARRGCASGFAAVLLAAAAVAGLSAVVVAFHMRPAGSRSSPIAATRHKAG